MQLERHPGFPQKNTAGLFWLGQAGFWLETGHHSVLIDPYLSDSLAVKYRGKKHDHPRMRPPPIEVADLPKPDVVLATHAHTDHMDPLTLGPLFERFPDIPFVVPAACEAQARDRIGAGARLVLVDADEEVEILPNLMLAVFPAAHEELRQDDKGRHLFLGYGVVAGALRLYHSGDSIPFDGLADRVAQFCPNIMLLPVNGRDTTRLADGIPGNFSLQEAIDVARDSDVLVPNHFEMFAFNTTDRREIERAARNGKSPEIVPPVLGETLRFV